MSRPIPLRRLYTAADIHVEHQPGARPGFEWFAEIRLGIGHAGPVSACCTASTRAEAVRGVLEMGPLAMHPVDVAHAALLDVGRPDLAALIVWFDDEHGGYIEVTDEIVSEADYVVIDRAETLARQVVGLGPYPRSGVDTSDQGQVTP